MYSDFINDSDVRELDPSEQKIVVEAIRRRMCIGKAIRINIPKDISKECIGYTGR